MSRISQIKIRIFPAIQSKIMLCFFLSAGSLQKICRLSQKNGHTSEISIRIKAYKILDMLDSVVSILIIFLM